MSSIAGIVANGNVYLAGDSLGSNKTKKRNYTHNKIFRKDNILIGCVGSVTLGQVMKYNYTVPARNPQLTLDEYIHTEFIDSIRNIIANSPKYTPVRGMEKDADCMLVAMEGRLFKIQSDLSILESDEGYEALGSGQDFTLAAIDALISFTDYPPKLILQKAMEITAKYSPTVGGDIHHLELLNQGIKNGN